MHRRAVLTAAAGLLVACRADGRDRVQAARERLGTTLKDRAKAVSAPWPPREVFVRACKHDQDGGKGHVEVFVGNARAPLVPFLRHPLCALSGAMGPKRQEGDLQIPEGFYGITALNPRSTFHLSLRVDYPNDADRRRGVQRQQTAPLGGDIMVHGDCVTIGCLPIEDEPIEEVYLTVAEVFGTQRRVPIHIFPRPLPDDGALQTLLATLPEAGADPLADETRQLWQELAVGYRAFEETKRVPRTSVDAAGRYVVRAA